jgi:hypothetical protein
MVPDFVGSSSSSSQEQQQQPQPRLSDPDAQRHWQHEVKGAAGVGMPVVAASVWLQKY